MQKEMNIDSLPPAIVYEPKVSPDHRPRSGSVQSNHTADTDPEIVDPEIAKAIQDLEISDSPTISLRKRIA